MLARYVMTRRVAAVARGFGRIVGRRHIVYHDPMLDPFEVKLFHRACGEAIDSLEKTFRHPLRAYLLHRARLGVYLFSSDMDVTRARGGRAQGYASFLGFYIAISAESDWPATIRHELTHIFSAWWNPRPIRALEEGIAVWAQRTCQDYPVDTFVLHYFYCAQMALECLLGPEPKTGDKDWHRFYMVAGSFTGFVIRRFGWESYRGFYRDRSVARTSFARRFEKHFGASISTVSRDWFKELRRTRVCSIPLVTTP
jgi:hypothetical protein